MGRYPDNPGAAASEFLLDPVTVHASFGHSIADPDFPKLSCQHVIREKKVSGEADIPDKMGKDKQQQKKRSRPNGKQLSLPVPI